MKQTKKLPALLLITIVMSLFLAACSAAAQTPTEQPDLEEPVSPVVSATGKVVPENSTTLSLSTAGVIAEVLAQENDPVASGQVLVRLQGREEIQAAIAAAKLELASAQYALDQLYKDPELKAAQASQAVVDARIAVRDNQRRLDNLNASTPVRDIEQASANLAILRDKLERARKDYRPYEKKSEDNLVRAGLLSRVAQLEKDVRNAERKLNNLLGSVNELDLAEAQADLDLAKVSLEKALREESMRQQGPDPQDIALAQARIENAKAQLAAAEAAFKDLELLAPFAGTATAVHVKPGQWVSPGQAVLELADLGGLHVETTDLNEIDVARIKISDTVLVTFDALPEISLEGKVTRIAPKAAEGAGVNYTVWVELPEIPENLRWGMTAFVDIEVQQ
jgi:multidrug resistance efflux pump